MKKLGIVIFTCLSSMTFAFDYPELSNPNHRKFLTLYLNDQKDVNKEDFFERLNTQKKWPCPTSPNEQYRLANLLLNEPLVQEKNLNDQNNSEMPSQNETKIINSNIKIIPLKAKCIDGKISGDLELLTEYDTLLDQYSKSTTNRIRFISKIHKITLSSGTIKDGILAVNRKSFSKIITQLKIETSPNEETKEFSDPIITLIMNYKDDIGNTASFSEETDFYIGGRQTRNLKSTFTEIIDKIHTRKTTYKNNHISSIEYFKNGTPHGDQLGYHFGMDDKINLIEARLPNSHPKLVKIQGINYIETHLCMNEGVEVEQFPCITKK